MKTRTLTIFAYVAFMAVSQILGLPLKSWADDWNAYHDLPADWDVYIGPLVVDLDRSGGKEVLSCSYTTIKMYNSSGTNYDDITIPGQYASIDGIPAVGDIRPESPDDHRPEIVVAAYGYFDYFYHSALWVYDYEGTLIDHYAVSSGVTYTQTTMADLDNNGDMEIIVMGRNSNNGKVDRVELFDWDGNEELVHHCFLGGLYTWGWPSGGWALYGETDWTSVCVGDMDRDGKKEVIAHAEDIIKAREVDNWNTTPNSIFTDFFELDIEDFLGAGADGKFSAMGFALAGTIREPELPPIKGRAITAKMTMSTWI